MPPRSCRSAGDEPRDILIERAENVDVCRTEVVTDSRILDAIHQVFAIGSFASMLVATGSPVIEADQNLNHETDEIREKQMIR